LAQDILLVSREFTSWQWRVTDRKEIDARCPGRPELYGPIVKPLAAVGGDLLSGDTDPPAPDGLTPRQLSGREIMSLQAVSYRTEEESR